MATAVTVSKTNNADIDGLLSGYKWSGTITYSFPDAPSDYANPYSGGDSEPTTSGFASAPSQMQAAINYAIRLINGYTNANIQYAGTDGADIMIAQSPAANPTSYAYYPGNYAPGGDIWFGTNYDYTQAKLGNYYFTTALHELGHAVGLKHSQETGGIANVAVPTAHDDSEYTVMSYRSYVGASTTAGYSNEAYGYPQTYMANDILALQTLYGANYTTQSGSTVYTWSPTTGQEFINGVGQLAPGGGAGGSANRIYEAVWDGGGVDTYDLSNYTTNLSINLNPGASSVFSSTQLANLGYGHYAAGNVYNAYLYNDDARSYIDNATGGSGNDTIIGNAIANILNGGSGNDTINGGGGNDTIIGGAGTDTAMYSGSEASYAISYNSATQTFMIVDQRPGSPDGTDTVSGVEYFGFADATIASSAFVAPITIESLGSTSLIQYGGNYYLDPVAGGTGPELKYYGSPVAVGQFGSTVPIGVEATASGYEMAWKVTGADLYSVWTTDSTGKYLSNTNLVNGFVSGADPALQALETSFQQDLNGDGRIGLIPAVAEANGSTRLTEIADHFYLYDSNGVGPSLKIYGTDYVQGQFGGWAPISAEQTSSGYEVAWKLAGADQYSVWTTDSTGHYLSNTALVNGFVTGADPALQALETSFQQDLNGDGHIGLVSTVIEANGSTSLVQYGGNYYLNPVAGGTGPELKYYGSPVAVGQFGSTVPIGVEATASGYEMAWKVTGADLYSVWTTDSTGKYLSNTNLVNGFVSGADPALQALETSFQQDLNGDGHIGLVSTVIEANGSTSLVQYGGNYYLNPVAGGTGPELKYYGSPVAVGQFGSTVPIGVEATASGYEMAWKVTGADLYSVWTTDSTGKYLSNTNLVNGFVSGADPALQALETSFQQDLNGDGRIGLIPAVAEANGSTRLTEIADHFYLYDSNGVGPSLKIYGTDYVQGQFGGWAPISAEQTSSGYEVAWKLAGADQYSVWTTDSTGHYLSNTALVNGFVTGADPALQALETSFQQDLNGDGLLGPSAHQQQGGHLNDGHFFFV
ncbi:M10 family metallopeptidase C-terminal domain-containing protein [Bradyrhizobium sp. CB1650]|uniref:M10 family metallopeptidase C-terminal domain-containing protein n=1 Tax=Bradyrhizobium sp. CB1650 TaxID=3039153 RepID=UPI002435A689|nr:M10 family metallopeptidase C-terminal domain-containing protein [Bradyrhizobium sp. CB1650]WGD55342.1 M10 family metallopeptidase C-terminal domain-containing protein [Bradyrhizobium sp. CB1650]